MLPKETVEYEMLPRCESLLPNIDEYESCHGMQRRVTVEAAISSSEAWLPYQTAAGKTHLGLYRAQAMTSQWLHHALKLQHMELMKCNVVNARRMRDGSPAQAFVPGAWAAVLPREAACRTQGPDHTSPASINLPIIQSQAESSLYCHVVVAYA